MIKILAVIGLLAPVGLYAGFRSGGGESSSARSDGDIRGPITDREPTGSLADAAREPAQRSPEPVQMAQAPAARPPAVKPAPPPAKPAAPAAQPRLAADPAQANAMTVVETYGEWRLQCFGTPVQRCELQQKRIDAQTQTTVFWVELASVAATNEETLSVITPLGMRVAAGLTFSVDGQYSTELQTQTCLQIGCVSQLKLTRPVLTKMFAGQAFRATVTNLAGQKITLAMPTTGFTDGYNRMFALTNKR